MANIATPPDVMVKGEHNPFVNSLLQRAQVLQDERTALMEEVAANREGLRSLRTQKLMSDEQAAALEEFYPTRERKSKQNKGDNKTFAQKETSK